MLYLVLGVILSIIVAMTLLIYANDGYEIRHGCAAVTGVLLAFASAIGCVVVMGLALEYKGAAVKAGVLNREYGTDYTRDEVFYASSVIDTIRELDRKRIEINGDLRRQRDPQRDIPAGQRAKPQQ